MGHRWESAIEAARRGARRERGAAAEPSSATQLSGSVDAHKQPRQHVISYASSAVVKFEIRECRARVLCIRPVPYTKSNRCKIPRPVFSILAIDMAMCLERTSEG